MKTPFTPGPWTQGGLDNNDRHWMRSVNADRNSFAWCGSGDDATAHANARLVAVAPELLDVLLEILQDHANCEVSTLKRAKALAVITKATGGTK